MASELPKGSEERKTILASLGKVSSYKVGPRASLSEGVALRLAEAVEKGPYYVDQVDRDMIDIRSNDDSFMAIANLSFGARGVEIEFDVEGKSSRSGIPWAAPPSEILKLLSKLR